MEVTAKDSPASELPTSYTDPAGEICHGDCIKQMESLDTGSIKLVFADPPFNIGYEYDQYDDRLDAEKYLAWSRDWIAQVYRVLDDAGAFWLAIGDEYAAELKLAAQEIGFQTRSWVVWYYTFGVHCKTKFTRSHAHLFYFVKDPETITFNTADIAVPSARQLVYGDKRANPAGRTPDDTWILRPQDCVEGFTAEEDTWYFPRVAGTFKERAGFHGCQMPEQLLGRIIKTCSDPGDVVMDPFTGSGTTLAVAKKLGRKLLGFELSADYAKLAAQRVAGVCSGDSLEGAPEPTVSAPATHSSRARRVKDAPEVSSSGWHNLTFDFSQLAGEAKGIIEAFAHSNRGYSVDRLVADPLLNDDFQLQCERRSLPGTAAERNRLLFRLRKSGKLKRADVQTNRRTAFSWNEMDPYLFASEIAWRRVSELYADAGLDEILCDPRLAEKFDAMAQSLAGGYSPLEYRWAALKLRKEGSKGRQRAERSTPKKLGLRKFKSDDIERLDKLDLNEVDRQPGVYAVMFGKKDYLYAGETMNLHSRLGLQLSDAARDQWPPAQQDTSELRVAICPLAKIDDARLARQSRMLKWYRPDWNYNAQLSM